DGTFQTAVHYDLDDFTYASAVAIGHLNPDGYADLVVANEFGPDISVLLGNGDGTFQAAVDYAAGTSPFSVGIEDLDLDGNADVAVANWTNTGVVWVFLGNGDGTLQAGESYATQSKAASVAIGDLDNDHVQDLAVANYGSDTVSVLLNLKEACNDTDGDGYGSPSNPSCAYTGDDCDNDNPDINPGASEMCNGVDDDCNGNTIDGADETWMGTLCDGPDSDECNEGTYSCEGAVQTCSDETGDTVEVCDGLDNDCNGFIGDWETDDDGDGYVECISWVGTDPEIEGGSDCDDHDAARNPGLEENLTAGNCEDGKDNDCNDLTDQEEPGCPTPGPCAAIPAS
ncbi:MAG: FG-GAP-like repeat-containing protein, partial [Thermodesulfobacteriota bacterium]